MKFKTFFQRRSAASMAESDPMSAASSSTKRKKKDAKPLTTTMKSAGAGTKSAFIAIARQEKCASCSAAASDSQPVKPVAEQHRQPQPDEFADSIRFNCENCGGCEQQRTLEICNVESAKLNDRSPLKADNMDLERAKQEIEEYKELLLKANDRIKELSDEVEKLKVDSIEKSKEFSELHDDFLLCIRGAERFRVEAELKAAKLESEMGKLHQELAELRNGGYDMSDGACVESLECNDSNVLPISSKPLTAASVVKCQNDHEAKEEKNISHISSDPDESPVREKGDCIRTDSTNKHREEKLRILRINCRGSLRNGLLNWCQARTKPYPNVEITNFSTSWSNGLALAALVHSLNPKEFDFDALSPSCPVDNFETALKAAVKLGIKSRLNAIKLIVESDNPPWEPIVAYVTEVYLAASN